MNTTWETHKFEHYIFSLLLAVEVIMSFTFLGYMHIPPISITTAYIPIVIIACLFGPAESSLAGLLFGLGSLYKASAAYVMPADAVFSPFRSDFPIGSILLSVGTRVLFGFCSAVCFSWHAKANERICASCSSQSRHLSCHALLVYTAMGLLFPLRFLIFYQSLCLKKATSSSCCSVLRSFWRLTNSITVPLSRPYKKAVNEYKTPRTGLRRLVSCWGPASTFIFCMVVLSLDRVLLQPYVLHAPGSTA